MKIEFTISVDVADVPTDEVSDELLAEQKRVILQRVDRLIETKHASVRAEVAERKRLKELKRV